MTDIIHLDGKEYISSKRASDLSGYAQDYIGQLARSDLIDAQRIGGLWYISMASLQDYKDKADTYKPQPPERKPAADPDSLISFDGKDYISAARASKITSYHQDYVGQLARSGAILSRQIGNRWYVERDGIIKHRDAKDKLLAAVQAESVGLQRPGKAHLSEEEPIAQLTYIKEDGELFPTLDKWGESPRANPFSIVERAEDAAEPVPIRILENRKVLDRAGHVKKSKYGGRIARKTIFYGTIAASALTIVILLTFGFSTFRNQSTYASGASGSGSHSQTSTLTASAFGAFNAFETQLEKWIVPELTYKREQW